MRLEGWPRRDILVMTAANAERMPSWSSTKLCHVQDVRSSRASKRSDGRRTSPGRALVKRVSTKNWLSNTVGVLSKGAPMGPEVRASAAASEWEARRATTSSELKPASAKRARIVSTESRISINNLSNLKFNESAYRLVQKRGHLEQRRRARGAR